MAGFRFEVFRGLRPRISATKLGEGESQTAENLKLGSTDLEPIPETSVVQATHAARAPRTIYLYNNDDSPIWFEWDTFVDVAPGPVKDDSLERTYYTGDTQGTNAPKLTTNELADLGGGGPYPESWWYIGVPAPVSAPTIVAQELPEDVPADERFGSFTATSTIVIDEVQFTVYPGTGTPNQVWTLSAEALGTINFDVGIGTSFRVTEKIGQNKVKVESATEPGITMRTLNRDKTSVNDWHPADEQDSTREADWLGFYVPPGLEVFIENSNLQVGDIITVTSLSVPFNWPWYLGGLMYEQNWPTPTFIQDVGGNYYQILNAEFAPTADPDAQFAPKFQLTGSFYYDVDRASSEVDALEERTYVYTYVNTLGEEGPPSPPSEVTAILDGSSTLISDMALPPTIGYDIDRIRLYRTNSTDAGTEFQFVKEFNVSATTTDNIETPELGEVISSTTWDPPDPGMQGLTSMPNGMMAGFNGKQVYFCEPYFPHAWPPEYDQATDFDIVGLAALGNSLIILTKGWPYIATGSHPRNINVRPIKVKQACLSKESIATDDDNVYYASPDGIVRISPNGVEILTEELIRPKVWRDTYSPETIVAEFFEGRYYAFYDFTGAVVDTTISAEVSGTITTAEEDDIVSGGLTIILTLTNDQWVASGAAFNNQRAAIIAGLSAATSQTLGWNNIIRDSALQVTDVVRTSNTVVTVTLPSASGYAIDLAETIQPLIPAAALVASTVAVPTASTFKVQPSLTAVTLHISGSLESQTEAEVVAGSETITLTLTNDQWVAAGTEFDAIRQNIIDGLSATTSQVLGFNNTVPPEISVTDVVRTSNSVITITLPAIDTYDIEDFERITATVPPSTLVSTVDTDLSSSNSIAVLATGEIGIVFGGNATARMTENEIVAGGKVLTITLLNDTWIAAGTGPIGTTAQSQSIIDALIATTSQSNGWNNVVVPGIEVADLVRTSATVATITLDPEATYSISQNEEIGATIPNDVLTTSTVNVEVANTFSATAQFPSTVILSGTILSSTTENDLVAGGKVITLTVSDDTWVAEGATFNAERQNIIDGLDGDITEWDLERANIPVTDVVRTSDTVVTITLSALAGYDSAADEIVTCTVPATALDVSASTVVASPTFLISYDVPATVALSGTVTGVGAAEIRDGGETIILTVSDDTLVAAGVAFNAVRQDIINGLTSGGVEANGWNNEVRDGTLSVTDVVRTSDTVVTITLPATPNYAVTGSETITVTVPAAALVQSDSGVVASPTFALDELIVTEVMAVIEPRNLQKARFSYVTDSFTAWTDDDVDADINSSSVVSRASVAYSTTDDRWAVVGRKDGLNYSYVFFTSDNDGVDWTERQVIQPSVSDVQRQLYWHPNNVFYAPGPGDLYYSTDGGVTWSTSSTYDDNLAGGSGAFSFKLSKFVYGGANRIVSVGYQVWAGVAGSYTYHYLRSPDITTPANIANNWSEETLAFDGVIDFNGVPNVGSGNGKNIFVMSEYQSQSNYNVYISTVPHDSVVESYVGKITEVFDGNFHLAAASATKIVFMNTSGHMLRVDVGDEGTIGNWDYPTSAISDTVSETLTLKIYDLFFDEGGPGKEGLGFVAVGESVTGSKGIIFTSPDGVTWTERHSTTPFDDRVYTGVTSQNPSTGA